MEKNEGSVYLRVGDSGVLELRARAVTIQQFADRYYNYWLGKEEPDYRVILSDCVLEPPNVGVFVFDGANLEEVASILAKEWELEEEVKLTGLTQTSTIPNEIKSYQRLFKI